MGDIEQPITFLGLVDRVPGRFLLHDDCTLEVEHGQPLYHVVVCEHGRTFRLTRRGRG